MPRRSAGIISVSLPTRAAGNVVAVHGSLKEGEAAGQSWRSREWPAGSAKEVEHDGRIYALFNVKGRITAIDGLCPHQGGPLADGHLEGDCVSCPWHGWEFDVSTGKSSMGPAMKQPVFNVKVEGSEILVEIP